MRIRFHAERGSAIIMGIVLMTSMLAVGLAAYSFVDTQQVETTKERQRESSFNLAEASLNSQSFVLSRRWAGAPTSFPATTPTCSSAAATALYCPDQAQVLATFNTPDYETGSTWSTTVYDDPTGPFYDSAVIEAKNASGTDLTAHWDQNGNRRVWVKAETTVRDRTRRLVALVQVQEHIEFIPKRVILAGQFELTPNGNGTYIKTVPDSTSQHPVTLRCNVAVTGCAEFTPDKKNPQLDPPGAIEGQQFVGKDALEDDVKERLKERAIADGKFYTSCPTSAQLTGKVVWVQGCADGRYTGNNIWNSPAKPGILIWADGALELGGRSEFWGIVYHLNNQNSSDDELLRLRGGLTINGGAFVDGNGGIDVGSNRVNIVYDERAFVGISSYGSASIVQNSWRDITGG